MVAVVLGQLTQVPRPRLVAWAILVTVLAALSYAANLADSGDTPDDLLYRWSSAVAGLVQYAIILSIVLAIARGIAPATLGIVRPSSWRQAAARVATALVGIWVIGAALNVFLQAGKEQGLVPSEWESSRAAPFIANFIVVAGVAPVVEELTYRGLGFAAVRDAFGAWTAVVVTALAFGLAHGLFVALPVLTVFGLILAWVRMTTGSIYPTIALHALFNAVALIAAVTV
jgi:membrane protease YdiL (CAAX protease family)